MASKFQRRQQWWVKFRDPRTGELVRESLETTDEARAELLRQRLDLEVALLEPRFQAAEIPQRLRERLGVATGELVASATLTTAEPALMASPIPAIAMAFAPRTRTPIEDAVKAYLRFIKSENAPLHFANKVSILRRFIGIPRMEKAGGPIKMKRRRTKNGGHVPDPPPFFTGDFLDEITPSLVQEFLESLGVQKKTMRHYRETFHHFFEFCLKFDLYTPTNWHRPNPISALPSYLSRNQRIVFLTQAQVDEQIAALAAEPAIQMAVTIMIYAGLRRAEALWLMKDSIAPDLSYLSVRNRRDEESDVESSLKTGERTVTILPPLKAILAKYLPSLHGKWIVPKPDGGRWRPDCFSNRLRAVNNKAGLSWTCLPYRHTYATQRAAEGWPLFRIAKEMGNSVPVVEEYYAGYIRPPELTQPVILPSNSSALSASASPPPASQTAA